MIIVTILIVLVSIFLAMNMGVSGFSVSFAPSYGSKALTKSRAGRKAVLRTLTPRTSGFHSTAFCAPVS